MQSLKCISFLFLLFSPTLLWAQSESGTYVDLVLEGPTSVERVPAPVIETGLLFSPQIGIGLRYEMEPFNGYFYHGLGAHLRLSTQTIEGEGWYLSASLGRGDRARPRASRKTRKSDKAGYLFSEFSIGRHISPHVIFSSGVRSVTEYTDVSSRLSPRPSKLLVTKFTFLVGMPPKSSSASFKKFNRRTYFFGLYSVNTRYYDDLRVNGMVNLGMGWKFSPRIGLGASLVLNDGINFFQIRLGENLDKLSGIGGHIFLRKEPFWGIVELGAANQVAVGRLGMVRNTDFIYQQHTKATSFYGRIAVGMFLNKHLIAQASFLLAPSVYGDYKFVSIPRIPGSNSRFTEQKDIYFSYADLNLGLGFIIE